VFSCCLISIIFAPLHNSFMSSESHTISILLFVWLPQVYSFVFLLCCLYVSYKSNSLSILIHSFFSFGSFSPVLSISSLIVVFISPMTIIPITCLLLHSFKIFRISLVISFLSSLSCGGTYTCITPMFRLSLKISSMARILPCHLVIFPICFAQSLCTIRPTPPECFSVCAQKVLYLLSPIVFLFVIFLNLVSDTPIMVMSPWW